MVARGESAKHQNRQLVSVAMFLYAIDAPFSLTRLSIIARTTTFRVDVVGKSIDSIVLQKKVDT